MRPTLVLAAAATAVVLTAGPAQAGVSPIQITEHTVTPNTGVTGTTADVHIECSASSPNVHIESVITFPDNSTLTVSDSGPTNYDSGSDTQTQTGVDGVRDVEITFVGVGEGTIETTCTQDFSQDEEVALGAMRAKAGLQSDTDTITFTVTAPETTPTSPTTVGTTSTSGQVASTVATNQPLARTGSSDTWLAAIGAALVAGGLAVTARSRRLRA